MEKVKVNRELFEALRKFEESNLYPFKTAMKFKSKGTPFISTVFLPLNNLNIEEIGKCLIIGYELEKTKEQILSEVYNEECLNDYELGFDKGIHYTLETLDIKIKGINL